MKTKIQIIESLIRAGHLGLEDALILLDKSSTFNTSGSWSGATTLNHNYINGINSTVTSKVVPTTFTSELSQK